MTNGTATTKLTLDDIADHRAYEREREDLRARVIALKKHRRVHVGPVVTLVFENRETVRFQVQEMARAERILSDAALQVELDTYNPLIPDPGHLSATLLIELTSRPEMEHWLPRLVGIERAVALRLPGEVGEDLVRAEPDPGHAAQLTREEVTASVHYLGFALTPSQVGRFAAGPVTLLVDHPAYREETRLGEETRASLLEDLRGEATDAGRG